MKSLHADRRALDQRVVESARTCGVEIVADRVRRLESAGEVLQAVETEDGARIEGDWFVDATGKSGQAFARHFGFRPVVQGPRRVSYWTRFRAAPEGEATVLSIEDPAAPRLEWVWEIPLSTEEISVGCVIADETATRP